MQLSEIIRRAEKELATATRNLDMAKRRGAPEQDVKNLEEKVEYRKTALQILKNSADVTILIDKINKKDKAIKALCYDFVDFATSGLYNMAPYCANMTNKCIHQNGWCKTDINSCKGFYPKAAIESED